MRRLLPVLAFVACGAVRPLLGQWHLGLEFATNTYRGSTHDTSSTHVASEGRPGGGVAVGLLFGRSWRRVGAALRVSFADPGFAVSGKDVYVKDKTTGRLLEVASLFSTRVGGIGPSGAIRAELGPALHLWDYGGEIRTRWSGLGAFAYEWPIAGRLTGAIRLEGMLSSSWFDATDVPPEFERRATWRYGVGLGLRYRLT